MRYFSFIITIFLALLLTNCKKKEVTIDTPKVDTIPMLVTQIQKCSRLYTTECHLHKIITHDDKVSLQGQFMKHDYNIDLPLGKRKIAIPMDAARPQGAAHKHKHKPRGHKTICGAHTQPLL